MRRQTDDTYRAQAQTRTKEIASRALRQPTRLILFAIFIAGLFALALRIRATSAPAPARPPKPRPQAQTLAPIQDPPGTIDGAKNPELIPDELAYKMLFLSLIEPENPTEAQKARQRVKVNRVGLTETDIAALLATVGEFRDQLAAIDSQVAQIHARDPVPSPNSTDWQQLAQLQKQKDQLVSDTISILSGRLTTDGVNKLQAQIWSIKHGIKRIPVTKPATY